MHIRNNINLIFLDFIDIIPMVCYAILDGALCIGGERIGVYESCTGGGAMGNFRSQSPYLVPERKNRGCYSERAFLFDTV